jgi:predicted transcriptional regulator
MKNMHITLSEDWLGRLDELSHRLERSRTTLVREAVMEYVLRREREMIEDEMGRYAEEMGPASNEFTRWTEAEVHRMLHEHTEW